MEGCKIENQTKIYSSSDLNPPLVSVLTLEITNIRMCYVCVLCVCTDCSRSSLSNLSCFSLADECSVSIVVRLRVRSGKGRKGRFIRKRERREGGMVK